MARFSSGRTITDADRLRIFQRADQAGIPRSTLTRLSDLARRAQTMARAPRGSISSDQRRIARSLSNLLAGSQ